MLLVDEVDCAFHFHHDHIGKSTHVVFVEGKNRELKKYLVEHEILFILLAVPVTPEELAQHFGDMLRLPIDICQLQLGVGVHEGVNGAEMLVLRCCAVEVDMVLSCCVERKGLSQVLCALKNASWDSHFQCGTMLEVLIRDGVPLHCRMVGHDLEVW